MGTIIVIAVILIIAVIWYMQQMPQSKEPFSVDNVVLTELENTSRQNQQTIQNLSDSLNPGTVKHRYFSQGNQQMPSLTQPRMQIPTTGFDATNFDRIREINRGVKVLASGGENLYRRAFNMGGAR